MFQIHDHQRLADGVALASPVIQAALDAATAAGGGEVVVPAGVYRCGTLRLGSHTHLRLLPGAVLRASHDLADYPPEADGEMADKQAHYGRFLIQARDAVDVTISGGVIDGQGPAFWEPSPGERRWIPARSPRVSPLIDLRRCRDLRLHDLAIIDSPGWTLHLCACDRVAIRGVTIDNHLFGPNTDGMDINGCRDVVISDCQVSCGDDAIVLKTTRESRSCERIVISNCILRSNCAALKCGTESWHDFRQIVMGNCVVRNSTRAFALYAFDGGVIEDVQVVNLVCDTDTGFVLNRPIHVDVRQRSPDSRRSTVRDVLVQGVSACTDGRILLTCADGCRAERITLSDVRLRYPRLDDPATEQSRNARSAQYCSHSPEARTACAAVVADGIHDLRLRDLEVCWPHDGSDVGWSGGPRQENGGDRAFAAPVAPPPHAVFWGRRLHGGRLDLGDCRASQPGTPRADLAGCQDLTLIPPEATAS